MEQTDNDPGERKTHDMFSVEGLDVLSGVISKNNIYTPLGGILRNVYCRQLLRSCYFHNNNEVNLAMLMKETHTVMLVEINKQTNKPKTH